MAAEGPRSVMWEGVGGWSRVIAGVGVILSGVRGGGDYCSYWPRGVDVECLERRF